VIIIKLVCKGERVKIVIKILCKRNNIYLDLIDNDIYVFPLLLVMILLIRFGSFCSLQYVIAAVAKSSDCLEHIG